MMSDSKPLRWPDPSTARWWKVPLTVTLAPATIWLDADVEGPAGFVAAAAAGVRTAIVAPAAATVVRSVRRLSARRIGEVSPLGVDPLCVGARCSARHA